MKRIRIHATHSSQDRPVALGAPRHKDVQEERFPAFVILYDRDDDGLETTIGHLALETETATMLRAGVEILGQVAPVLGLQFELTWTGWQPPAGQVAPEIVEQILAVVRMLGLGKEK